jgi:hypothetical protein
MEQALWLDRVIASLKSEEPGAGRSWTQNDARCYELVDEMGEIGFSCLIYTGASRLWPGDKEEMTFCQLRSAEGGRLGANVKGSGPAATREAICRAYLALRLHAGKNEDRFNEPERPYRSLTNGYP